MTDHFSCEFQYQLCVSRKEKDVHRLCDFSSTVESPRRPCGRDDYLKTLTEGKTIRTSLTLASWTQNGKLHSFSTTSDTSVLGHLEINPKITAFCP